MKEQESRYSPAAEQQLREAGQHLPEGLSLIRSDGKLTLTDGKEALCGDFAGMKRRIREANLRQELLVKAARVRKAPEGRRLKVLDATAGLGEDDLLLAASGMEVELYERDPVIAALLEDAAERALCDGGLSAAVRRMRIHRGDSIEEMRRLGPEAEADLVYLDPMFPERQKSALIRKKFQLLHLLEQPCTDEEALLEAALSVKPFKIIIKRPARGPYLAGRKPSYSMTGSAIRYDCLVFPENLRA